MNQPFVSKFQNRTEQINSENHISSNDYYYYYCSIFRKRFFKKYVVTVKLRFFLKMICYSLLTILPCSLLRSRSLLSCMLTSRPCWCGVACCRSGHSAATYHNTRHVRWGTWPTLERPLNTSQQPIYNSCLRHLVWSAILYTVLAWALASQTQTVYCRWQIHWMVKYKK